ncbi:unnamed protein product [Nippostrongylus brasiliensis]|uniref:E3 ubiquitin-protein ligase n=1 Tax=Nippostrongylus brasiliensis TaxID=27835 RepID=A0A158R1Z1_NIPBR|nr:unnamed protein product [Nippostrongylus brasiliensis]
MIVDLVSAARQADWDRARELLYHHWGSECPKLYAPNPEHPWEDLPLVTVLVRTLSRGFLGVLIMNLTSLSHPVNIDSALFVPLAGAFCADSAVTDSSLKPLIEQAGMSSDKRRPGQICGHVFKSGELTYSCKDCATDATCVMCHECFHLSEHKAHKYKMHTSTGAGYCDCGDKDAWRSGYACKLHEDNEDDVVPFSLPEPLELRLRGLTCLILQYSTKLICWEKADVLPINLTSIPVEKPEVPSIAPYVTVLYNDETHTYETVIRALEMFINCTKDQAMLIATIVDREGRSSVKVGAKPDCERVKSEIQAGPLDVKVMDGALVAHQNHAIALLSWLNSQIDSFPARANTHQMLMKTVLMNFEQKHYDDIYAEFIDDDHDIDISIVSLTVQFLTVPSIARRLIAEDGAMRTIFTTLMKHTDKFTKGNRFHTNFRYILTCVPSSSDWSDQLRERFLEGCQALIQFLHRMQGMDEVKRLSVEHQVWELEWETAFNIQLRIQDSLGYFLLQPDTDEFTEDEKYIRQQVKKMATTLYEMPLRALVLCAQASAQLWRRNGFSLVGAAIRPPTDFLLHIICRFRLVQWADQAGDGGTKYSTPFGKMEPEETGKIIVILAEEMLHLLIMILGERYHPGVGKCSFTEQVQREVIHVLCTGPQPFSHFVNPAAHGKSLYWRKPTTTSAGQFHLKESLLPEYNPFFYHYSKSDLSQAEQYQQKIRSKLDRKLQACPPPSPIEFEPFFAPVRNILKTSCLVKIFKLVLERTGKRSRFSSDRLFHRALFLIGMALQEQARDLQGFQFTVVAEKEEILRSLEALSGSVEVATHADLLWWTIQKYKEVHRLSTAGNAVEKRGEVIENQESQNDLKAKRAARAAKMREQAMLKMSKMQKSFLKVIEAETPAVVEANKITAVSAELRGDDDEDYVSKQQDHGFPVCLGLQRSRVEEVLPRKVTCILCQEEETLSPDNGKAFVCAAYVQNLSETLLSRERQRPRQQMVLNQKMVDPEVGEYLCPLCKRLSNTAMPLLPALQLMDIDGFSTASSDVVEDFDSWVTRLKSLLDTPPLAKQGDELSTMPLDNSLSTSVPSASTMSLLLGQKTPARLATQATSNTSCNAMDVDVEEDPQRAVDLFREMTEIMRVQNSAAPADVEPTSPPPYESSSSSDLTAARRERRSDGTARFGLLGGIIKGLPAAGVAVLLKLLRKIVGPSYERYEEMVKGRVRGTEESKARDTHDDVHSPPAALAVWKSAAHVARTTAAVLANERKPLFCAMNTRQRDCLLAMARLSAVLSFCIQLLPDFIANMLRVLLSPPPVATMSNAAPVSPKSPDYHMATSPLHNFTTSSPLSSSADSPAKLLSSTFAQLFSSKKDVNVNLLHVDMLTLAISLMMSIGWTWHDGVQSLKTTRQLREMLPDGSQDELHVFVTFEDSEMSEAGSNEKLDSALAARLRLLWSIVRPSDAPLTDVSRLLSTLSEATLSLLRPLALFYHALTLIDPPEALKDPSVDEFEPLCRYMGLPSHLADLVEGLAIEQLFDMIRDCAIVLMTTRNRGCFRPAPYVDEFGEADQGFRRGNPLHLNEELYHKLRQLWLQQGIAEEVVNQYEIDHRNMQYDWGHF